MRRAAALIPLLTLLGTLACKGERLEFREMPIGGDVELTAQTGKRGKISESFLPATLLFFGFSRCPDFCPMTLHKIEAALKKEPALAEKTRLIFISVDSQNEKPADLEKFLSPYPFARGFSGSAAEIAGLERKFGAYSEKKTSTISHSLYLYVLNKSGKVIYLLRHDEPTEKILAAIRQAAELTDVRGSPAAGRRSPGEPES